MAENDQKPQDQQKPPPPPVPVLNHVILAVVGLLLVLSPVILLSGSGSVAGVVARILSGESVLTAMGIKVPGDGEAGQTGPADGVPQPPVVDLAEVFRFDVTPDWVVLKFPRVTTGLAILQLQGYRVPLVTGTAEDDLVGTLTYYFDAARQVRRITFEGTTGNPNRLLAFLTGYYGFVYRPTNNPAVYLYVIPEEGSRGQTHSYLWIRPRPILTADDPHHRFDLSLVLERSAE